jgi:hypothetical protein
MSPAGLETDDYQPEIIDLRAVPTETVFLRLREVCAAACGERRMEILLDRTVETRRVRAFLLMSGFRVEVQERDEIVALLATGGCGCR